jgi:hypothetical protein
MSRENLECAELETSGVSRDVAGGALISLIKDQYGNILFALTTDADPPTNFTGAGLAKGAIVIKTDAAAGQKAFYTNKGTTLVSDLVLL